MCSIEPQATLAQAVDRLVEKNIGSLVVFEDGKLVGIITERDILRACSGGGHNLSEHTVQYHMSSPVITGTPHDRIDEVMGLLTEKRIRHLPIVDGGEVVGIISIGDVVKAQHDLLTLENHYLKDYLQRR